MVDTLIEVDVSESSYKTTWFTIAGTRTYPMVVTVEPGDEFIVECCDWTEGAIGNNDSADNIRVWI